MLIGLNQLEKLNLLEHEYEPAGPLQFAVLSRRQMIRNLGLAAAVAVPVVTSIVAPTAVQAATCIQSGVPCSPTVLCCHPLGCNPAGKCR